MTAQGYWDIHNHILPGLDDGSGCMEETLELLEQEHEQGIRNIVFTPHFRPGMFEVSPEEREEVFQRIYSRIKEIFPDMEFYLGCEYFAHSRMLADIRRDSRNRMAGTNAVLLEFKTIHSYNSIQSAVIKSKEHGLRPVVAHVERYQSLCGNLEKIQELKRQGAFIQINSGTLLGNSGMQKKKFCMELIKNGLADFVASDAHDPKRRVVNLGKSIRKISKKFGEETAEKIFVKNPWNLFEQGK